MNKGFFTGRVAAEPKFRAGTKTPVCYLTLIDQEFAGMADGVRQERTVSLPLTAFGATAERVAEHAMVGDQLIVEYRVMNNDRSDSSTGATSYGFTFVLDDFTFGAPGKAKRERMNQA